MSKTWIGVDFDGTISTYYGWTDKRNGIPIKPMVERVKKWIADGKVVKIMTARVSSTNHDSREVADQRAYIQDWCEKHVGKRLDVTCEKDHLMEELWDDRARRVIFNRGFEYDPDPQGPVSLSQDRADREFKDAFKNGVADMCPEERK